MQSQIIPKELREVPNPNDKQHAAFRILEGDYEGVVFSFVTIGIAEDDNEFATINFKYEVYEDLGLITSRPHFEEYIASMLKKMIDAADEDDSVENDRTGHTSESASEGQLSS